MLIDTHCHLCSEYLPAAEVSAVISRAHDVGVGTLILPCAAPDDAAKVIALCDEYENLFCTIGIHPEFPNAVPNYESFLSHPKCVGVGEIGLDYHYGSDDRDAQIKLFRAQLEIAQRANLPVAIHTRDAEIDTAEILNEYHDIPGVMHCFTGGWDLAQKMLDRGYYFSASGILTFKNAEDLRETFRKIPTDRIVVETDSPYCAPIPHRGKKCEPAFIIETAKVLAQIKNLQLDELEIILEQNTKRLYPKLCPEIL